MHTNYSIACPLDLIFQNNAHESDTIRLKGQCIKGREWQGSLSHKQKRVTVMILSFRTDGSGQTDQGLHCLSFHLDLLDKFFYGITFLFEF